MIYRPEYKSHIFYLAKQYINDDENLSTLIVTFAPNSYVGYYSHLILEDGLNSYMLNIDWFVMSITRSLFKDYDIFKIQLRTITQFPSYKDTLYLLPEIKDMLRLQSL